MRLLNNLSIRVVINRFLARLKHLLRFGEYLWYYETCNRCGTDYCLGIGIKDETWIKVNGRDGGCLCLNCFVKIAQKKGIEISLGDFEWLWIFNPDGKCFDIIKKRE